MEGGCQVALDPPPKGRGEGEPGQPYTHTNNVSNNTLNKIRNNNLNNNNTNRLHIKHVTSVSNSSGLCFEAPEFKHSEPACSWRDSPYSDTNTSPHEHILLIHTTPLPDPHNITNNLHNHSKKLPQVNGIPIHSYANSIDDECFDVLQNLNDEVGLGSPCTCIEEDMPPDHEPPSYDEHMDNHIHSICTNQE